jgi:tetratricopeptide (TPR) repeat protein
MPEAFLGAARKSGGITFQNPFPLAATTRIGHVANTRVSAKGLEIMVKSSALPPVPGADAEFETWNQKANALLNARQLQEAVYAYRKALEFKSDAGAYHNLAVAFAKQGMVDEAIDSFTRSVSLRPESAETMRNLGVAYSQKGRRDDAIASFRKALQLDPNNAQAYLDLGNLFFGHGDFEEALFHFQQAIRVRPQFAAAHHALGRATGQPGKHAEAIPHFEQAIRLQPDLADAHHDLGVALQELNKFEEAAVAFRRALKFNPHSAQTYSNLGVALAELGQDDESVANYEEALRRAPNAVEIHNNYGNSLRMMGRLDEALAHFCRALELKPEDPGAFNNMGIAHVYAGQIHEALACYDRALDKVPEFPSAHLNRSFAWLTLGDYERGWEEYEWRWREKKIPPRNFAQPQWDGAPLDGKPILIYAEQGFGDTLQFIRYAAQVKERGGVVIFEAPPPLLQLLCDVPGIDQLVARGSPLPDFAVHCALLGLPRLFKTDAHNIPAKVPYLFAERRRLEAWKGPIRALPGFRIGIAWQGSKGFKADRHRSIPLKYFAPLAKIPGVELVSLQKGYGSEQIAQVAKQFSVRELGPQVDQDGAFLDTVAIMQHLDLVITSDTSLAHVAGALGVPVWVAISAAADWRWLLDRDYSPWYPTMRLFRQSKLGDWPGVLEQIAAAVAEKLQLAASAGGGPPALMQNQEAEALHQQAVALLQQGKWAEGEAVLRQVLAKQHRWDAHQNLGVALARQGKLDEAVSLFKAYLDHHPHSADGYNNLGLASLDANRLNEAERYFRQALRYKSDNPESHSNLGVVLLRQEKWDAAAKCFEEALQLREAYPEAQCNLAFVLRKQKKPVDALAHYLRALEVRPDAANAHIDAGLTLVELQRLEEAEHHFRHATELQPNSPDAFNNLGILLADLQRLDEAEAALERAVQLRPEDANTHRNFAMVLLAAAKLERGWHEYEWRWKCGPGTPDLPPRWDGSPLEGRTILVSAEQGFGDTLHFARYLPLVKNAGGKVVFVCPPPLIPILKSSSLQIDQIVPQAGPMPKADVSAGLMSLAGLLPMPDDKVPADIPYLFADPALVESWRLRLRHVGGFRVGIAWQGSPGYGGDRYRSIPLKHFAALTRFEDVQLISLQKGHGVEQLARAEMLPVDLGRQIDETAGAFLDSAAVMRNLDLVVTLDSSIAHLAGALGVETWIALSTCSDWRWFRGREDSPWYPTVRLFRQRTRGDWDHVFDRITQALQLRIASWSAGRMCRAPLSVGELVDKITILEIKQQNVADPAKRKNVETELEALMPLYRQIADRTADLAELKSELKLINQALWEIEDAIRDHERAKTFDTDFITLARSVYQTNDRRAAVKRRINDLAGSTLVEEKAYAEY